MNRKYASLATSAAVAGLTLAVFAAAQSAGPESAVRRYLQALEKRDRDLMSSVINAPFESGYNQWLISQSESVLSAKMRVVGKEASGNLVLVVTNHEMVIQRAGEQQRMDATIFWVLVRSGGVWQIDPQRTYNFRAQNTFLRR